MKRILLIDDNDQQSTLEVIKNNYEDIDQLETYWFNPVDRKYYKDDLLDLDASLTTLTETYFSKKMDIVGCDIGLGSTEESTAFKIASKIREHDRCCTLFMYSGGMTEKLLKSMKEDGNSGERLLREIISADIRKITNARQGVLKDTILELLDKPSIQLQVLDFLENHSDLQIETKYFLFRNKSIAEIAKEIQIQSIDGIKYTREIIEQGLSILLELNSN